MKTKIFKLVEFLIKKGKVNKEEPPFDLKEAFTKFTNGENHMSKDQLLQFMVEYQGEQNCTLLDLEPIFEKLLQNGSSSNESTSNIAGLSLDKFIDFLLLDDFNGPLKNEVHHDMNAPLSHYFMYTGHNSYLTGNQLTSESSDEPIIEALKQGVRVIELDLWASTKHGGIKVVHGRTLTTPVPLTKCLESIKEHAFVKSDFPVILTLEDHLTPKLQAKFAEVAVQIFGEMLYCPQTDFLTEFPSPASLKKMIVISTKPPKEYPQPDGVSNQVPNGSESSEDETWELQDSIVKLDKEDINTSDYKSNQQSPCEYRQLITIHGGKSEGTMKDRLKVDDGKVRRLSLSEKKLKTASESHGADLIRFTQKNILRIFPKGERVKSSNFRPHLGWMYGAQMVAFNMQGYGKSLRLMQGMFKANGGCGYVKKPEQQQQQQPTSDPHNSFQTAPNWLNNALLRNLETNVNATTTTATNNSTNFLNLDTTGAAAGSQSSGQWLSRPILHRNQSEVIDNIAGDGLKTTESGETAAEEGVMNWQKAKYKGEIMAHPLYEQLLSAHVACLRIATPVDQLPRIDAQLAESQNVVAKYSAFGQGMLDDDNKQLDHFMSHYVLLLCSFKEQLQQHVRVHAMEAVMACWEIEQSLQSLTGVSPGEGTGATMSEDEDEQVDSDVNLFDGGMDGSDNSMGGFGPLVLTENERSLMERVRHELKHELKQGYKEKIVDIREEILRKRRAGKLPGDTTSVLKDWWQSHSKWPYPTEEDKARLVQETGLQLKQINNWFINQRKRNWHSNPSTSNVLKSKRKR